MMIQKSGSVRTLDLDTFIAERGLRSVNASSHLSHEGKSACLEITADDGYSTFAIAEYLRVSADGFSLIIRSGSRFSEEYGQVSAGFVLDVDTGSMYSLTDNYSSDPDLISADASVFLGTSDYPAYDLLIGKR